MQVLGDNKQVGTATPTFKTPSFRNSPNTCISKHTLDKEVVISCKLLLLKADGLFPFIGPTAKRRPREVQNYLWVLSWCGDFFSWSQKRTCSIHERSLISHSVCSSTEDWIAMSSQRERLQEVGPDTNGSFPHGHTTSTKWFSISFWQYLTDSESFSYEIFNLNVRRGFAVKYLMTHFSILG